MEWWQLQELMWTVTGILVVLLVAAGLTARFAIKPFLRDLSELREGRQSKGLIESHSDERLERIEQHLEHLDGAVNRLLEVSEFDRQLKSGPPPQKADGP